MQKWVILSTSDIILKLILHSRHTLVWIPAMFLNCIKHVISIGISCKISIKSFVSLVTCEWYFGCHSNWLWDGSELVKNHTRQLIHPHISRKNRLWLWSTSSTLIIQWHQNETGTPGILELHVAMNKYQCNLRKWTFFMITTKIPLQYIRWHIFGSFHMIKLIKVSFHG